MGECSVALKKVLLAYDGSEGGNNAADWAVSFACQTAVETYIAE